MVYTNISQTPTNLLLNSLACIDLILTDQINLAVDSGVHSRIKTVLLLSRIDDQVNHYWVWRIFFNFDKLLNHIKQVKPSFTILLSDFNARSKFIISTDQTNLAVDSDVHPSIHVKCNHQIINLKLNLMIVYPPPCERLVWDYERAITDAIINSIN